MVRTPAEYLMHKACCTLYFAIIENRENMKYVEYEQIYSYNYIKVFGFMQLTPFINNLI